MLGGLHVQVPRSEQAQQRSSGSVRSHGGAERTVSGAAVAFEDGGSVALVRACDCEGVGACKHVCVSVIVFMHKKGVWAAARIPEVGCESSK